MTTTIVMNLKGGPGKTTVINGLAHAAAARGEDVLLADGDPQGNATTHLTGYDADNLPPAGTLADVLDRRIDRAVEDVVIPAKTRERIYVVPSGFGETQAVADSLIGTTGAELSVRRAFRSVRKNGRVLFDSRPAVDFVTRAIMLSSDNVLLVTQPEFDSVAGMRSVFTAVKDLYNFTDYELPIVGVVINMVDARREDHAEYVDYIRNYCVDAGVPVLGDPIPRLADISRLTIAGLGMDQHPKPSATSRWLANNFDTILQGLDKERA